MMRGLVAISSSAAVAAISSSATTTAAAKAAASTATAAVATTTAAATVSAAATTAGTALFARTGFVDGECSAVVFLAIQRRDRGLGFVIGSHFDKAKAFASAGVAIVDDL